MIARNIPDLWELLQSSERDGFCEGWSADNSDFAICFRKSDDVPSLDDHDLTNKAFCRQKDYEKHRSGKDAIHE